jgi:DNA-binding transcriptional LysR family regulator
MASALSDDVVVETLSAYFGLNTIVYLCSAAYNFLMKQTLSSWDLVHVFLTVMQQGSLSAAARHLKLSQPTVRRQIESLEAELGSALFTRSLTGLLPTDTATALLPQAEAMQATVGAFQRNASDPAKADEGVVRITCSDVFGVEVMPPLLAPLLAQHPRLVIELVLSNHTDDLLKREADIAVRLTAPHQAALLAKKVAPVEIGLFASKAFLQSHKAPKTLNELSLSARFIGDDQRHVLARGFAFANLKPPQNLVLRTDSDLAQLAALRAGVGIGVCQTRIAKTSGLVRILPSVSLMLPCWVLMHEDLRHVKRIKLVFDHVARCLGKAVPHHPD